MKTELPDRAGRWAIGVALLVAIVGLAVVNRPIEPPMQKLPTGWRVVRPPKDALALVIDGPTVWAVGKDGVAEIDRQTVTVRRSLKADRSLENVRSIALDSDGNLWLGHQNGLTVFGHNQAHTYTEKDGLPGNQVNALMRDHQGRLWVGTWKGVVCIERDGYWRKYTKHNGLMEDMVNTMVEDREGGIWFGSYVAPRGGVSRLYNGTWQHFGLSEGLPHLNITALFCDQQGAVWAGTGLWTRGGAAQFTRNGTTWSITRVFTEENAGLAGPKVRSIFQDHTGVYWFGSEADGMANWDGRTWRVFTTKDGLVHQEVTSFAEDQEQNLWLTTLNGVLRISADAVQNMRVQAGNDRRAKK